MSGGKKNTKHDWIDNKLYENKVVSLPAIFDMPSAQKLASAQCKKTKRYPKTEATLYDYPLSAWP